MTLADRIVVMRDGYIEQVGNPIELFQKPVNTFVAGFIGIPPMNLHPAEIVSKDNKLMLDFQEKLQIPIPEKPGAQIREGMEVIVGLRPEDLMLDRESNEFTNTAQVNGLTEVVEPLGSETYIHLNIKSLRFQAKSVGRKTISPGDRLNLLMNLEHLYIFDSANSKLIY